MASLPLPQVKGPSMEMLTMMDAESQSGPLELISFYKSMQITVYEMMYFGCSGEKPRCTAKSNTQPVTAAAISSSGRIA